MCRRSTPSPSIHPPAFYPGTIAVSCTSGLPTGATCTETTPSFQNLNGSVSTDVIINTIARVTTTTSLFPRLKAVLRHGTATARLGVLGVGMGRVSRARRAFMTLLLGGFFALILFQASCSSSKSVTTTTGTPAGTYVVTVSGISGSAYAHQDRDAGSELEPRQLLPGTYFFGRDSGGTRPATR